MNQMECLENYSDRFAPDLCPFGAGQVLGGSAIQPDLSRGRQIQTRNKVQEGTFSAATWTHEGAKFAGLHL
jgi:hypothetical protein